MKNQFAVNMASFSKTIFEDEFFGHAKGAYTDASSDRRGFFEAAQGGTLFLDEITELDPSLQAKLLRVIEEREFYRLSSTEIRNVDVRIIAATNRDINEEIIKNHFRADLFYRINMYNIKIPPLRERKDDILPLANHFLKIHKIRIFIRCFFQLKSRRSYLYHIFYFFFIYKIYVFQ